MRRIASITIVMVNVLVAVAPRVRAVPSGDRSTPSVPPIVTNATPHFSGDWKLDAKRSDVPPRPPGGDPNPGGAHGGSGGGSAGSRPDHGTPHAPGPGGPRPPRWPDRIHITQTPDLISIQDSTGVLLEQVSIGGPVADTMPRPSGPPRFAGSWFGDSLEVEHWGPNGGKATQIVTLADHGETLVIRTRLTQGKDQREFKRVYRRLTR